MMQHPMATSLMEQHQEYGRSSSHCVGRRSRESLYSALEEGQYRLVACNTLNSSFFLASSMQCSKCFTRFKPWFLTFPTSLLTMYQALVGGVRGLNQARTCEEREMLTCGGVARRVSCYSPWWWWCSCILVLPLLLATQSTTQSIYKGKFAFHQCFIQIFSGKSTSLAW